MAAPSTIQLGVGTATPFCSTSTTLGDAAEAVREFHEAQTRVTPGDVATSALWRRAMGAEGHRVALAAGSCEAEVLRAWIEGRPTRSCPSR